MPDKMSELIDYILELPNTKDFWKDDSPFCASHGSNLTFAWIGFTTRISLRCGG